MNDIAPAPAVTAALSFDTLPGPRGWPLLGNAPQIEPGRFHQQLEQWAREFGPLYRIRMGPRPILVSGDHAAVAAALRERPEGFRRTSRFQQVAREMGLESGLFGSEGEIWRRQRRMVMAAFDPGHVRSYFPALQRCAQRLEGRWQRAAASGAGIDLQADLMRFTVDAIAGLAFGTEVNTLETDGDVIQQHLDKIFPKLYGRIISVVPYWRYVRLPSDRALDRAIAQVNDAIAGFVAAARRRLADDPARRAEPPNLLEAMIVAADEPGSGIDDRQVAGNVLTMLLAGEDTTAHTLAWCIWLLWSNPAAMARARDEARRALPDGAVPTLATLGALDWLEACAHETMRLKPVAPQLPLETLADTEVAGLKLPRGTIVINLMRRDSVDERHVPEAASFRPERWLAEGGPAAQAASVKRVAMPFGAGPRICPGRYLALMEMKLVLAVLLSRFDVASLRAPGGGEPEERLAFTMAPVGLEMRLAPRS